MLAFVAVSGTLAWTLYSDRFMMRSWDDFSLKWVPRTDRPVAYWCNVAVMFIIAATFLYLAMHAYLHGV
jgi:hypothetical protein